MRPTNYDSSTHIMEMEQHVTAGIDVVLKKSYRRHAQKCRQLSRCNSERIAAVQLKMHVDMKTKISLNPSTQCVQQELYKAWHTMTTQGVA